MDNGPERALRNVNRPLDIIERVSNGQPTFRAFALGTHGDDGPAY